MRQTQFVPKSIENNEKKRKDFFKYQYTSFTMILF